MQGGKVEIQVPNCVAIYFEDELKPKYLKVSLKSGWVLVTSILKLSLNSSQNVSSPSKSLTFLFNKLGF